jgi:hypothetical protein
MFGFINVVFLYVGNKPKGVWKENDLVSYTGKVWWDSIHPVWVSKEDWVSFDIHKLHQKYVR